LREDDRLRVFENRKLITLLESKGKKLESNVASYFVLATKYRLGDQMEGNLDAQSDWRLWERRGVLVGKNEGNRPHKLLCRSWKDVWIHNTLRWEEVDFVNLSLSLHCAFRRVI